MDLSAHWALQEGSISLLPYRDYLSHTGPAPDAPGPSRRLPVTAPTEPPSPKPPAPDPIQVPPTEPAVVQATLPEEPAAVEAASARPTQPAPPKPSVELRSAPPLEPLRRANASLPSFKTQTPPLSRKGSASKFAYRDVRILNGEDVPRTVHVHRPDGSVYVEEDSERPPAPPKVEAAAEEPLGGLEGWQGPHHGQQLAPKAEDGVVVEDVYLAGLSRAPRPAMEAMNEVQVVWDGVVLDVERDVARVHLRGFRGMAFANLSTGFAKDKDGRDFWGGSPSYAEDLREMLRPGQLVSVGTASVQGQPDLLYCAGLFGRPPLGLPLSTAGLVLGASSREVHGREQRVLFGAALLDGEWRGWAASHHSLDHSASLDFVRRRKTAPEAGAAGEAASEERPCPLPTLGSPGAEWATAGSSVRVMLVGLEDFLAEELAGQLGDAPLPVSHFALLIRPVWDDAVLAEGRLKRLLPSGAAEVETDLGDVFVPASLLGSAPGVGADVSLSVCPELPGRANVFRALNLIA